MSFYKEVPGRKTTLESALKFDEAPTAGSTNPVTSGGVAGAIGKSTENSLDDHDTDELIVFDVSKDFYDEHELGYYYAIGDKVWLCTEHTRSGEPGSYTYHTELTKQNGIVPVINELIRMSEVVAAAFDNLDARVRANEEAVSNINIGDRIADRIDVQELLVGGENVLDIINNA